MWITADYEATSLFSLKPSAATSSGGKTLVVPTPFAIKMALLDVICRAEGEAAAQRVWPVIRDMVCALRPAERVVVNHTLNRIQKPRRMDKDKAESLDPMQPTVGYREYAQLAGHLGLALSGAEQVDLTRLLRWLASIQYLGKRGSFMQLQALPTLVETLPDDYLIIDGSLPESFDLNQVMLELDDTTRSTSFDRVNIYSDAAIRQGTDRIMRTVILPYSVAASSQRFTYLQRSDDE